MMMVQGFDPERSRLRSLWAEHDERAGGGSWRPIIDHEPAGARHGTHYPLESNPTQGGL